MTEGNREIIERPLERLVDRLRSASEAQLTRHDDQLDGGSLTEAAFRLSQWCVDSYQEITGAQVPSLPRLDPFASGDQLWVTASELLGVLDDSPLGETLRQELFERIDVIRRVS